MQISKHLVRIIAGYVAATFVALLAGIFLAWLSPGPGAAGRDFDFVDFISLATVYWLLLAVLAAIPALVVIVIAEAVKLRSLLAHILVGSFIGFLFTGQSARISPWLNVLDVPVQSAFASAIMVVAGALGAIAYWRIAGKYAGIWREV